MKFPSFLIAGSANLFCPVGDLAMLIFALHTKERLQQLKAIFWNLTS